jgi:hypothetical protein
MYTSKDDSLEIVDLPAPKLLPVFIYCGGLCANFDPILRQMSEDHKCATCGSDNYALVKSVDLDALKMAKALQDDVIRLEQQLCEQQKSLTNLEEELYRLRFRRKSTAVKIKRLRLRLAVKLRKLGRRRSEQES